MQLVVMVVGNVVGYVGEAQRDIIIHTPICTTRIMGTLKMAT